MQLLQFIFQQNGQELSAPDEEHATLPYTLTRTSQPASFLNFLKFMSVAFSSSASHRETCSECKCAANPLWSVVQTQRWLHVHSETHV